MKFLLGYFIVGISAKSYILGLEKTLGILMPNITTKWTQNDKRWKFPNLVEKGICSSENTSLLCCLAKDKNNALGADGNRKFKFKTNLPCCLNAAINEQIGHQVGKDSDS